MLKLDETLKHYLDAESLAPRFRVDGPVVEIPYEEIVSKKVICDDFACEAGWEKISGKEITLDNLKFMVAAMGECIIRNEASFCQSDSYAGDGDFGMSVAKGFKQLRNEWKDLLAKEDIGRAEYCCYKCY